MHLNVYFWYIPLAQHRLALIENAEVYKKSMTIKRWGS